MASSSRAPPPVPQRGSASSHVTSRGCSICGSATSDRECVSTSISSCSSHLSTTFFVDGPQWKASARAIDRKTSRRAAEQEPRLPPRHSPLLLLPLLLPFHDLVPGHAPRAGTEKRPTVFPELCSKNYTRSVWRCSSNLASPSPLSIHSLSLARRRYGRERCEESSSEPPSSESVRSIMFFGLPPSVRLAAAEAVAHNLNLWSMRNDPLLLHGSTLHEEGQQQRRGRHAPMTAAHPERVPSTHVQCGPGSARCCRAPPSPCPRAPPPSSSPWRRSCDGEWRGLQRLTAARVATTSAAVAVAASWRLQCRVQPRADRTCSTTGHEKAKRLDRRCFEHVGVPQPTVEPSSALNEE